LIGDDGGALEAYVRTESQAAFKEKTPERIPTVESVAEWLKIDANGAYRQLQRLVKSGNIVYQRGNGRKAGRYYAAEEKA
jgi:predicted transcriptional regulator